MEKDSWSVLPTDLLSLLLNLVSFRDLVRLTAVCKTWRQPVLDDLRRRHRNMPWIISLDNGELIDPWLNNSYSLLKTTRHDGLEELLIGTTVHASKYGWLLMSKQEVTKSAISFLFYNPFRDEIIELPPLELNADTHESKAMFSTTPTSSDRVIFVLSRVTREGTVVYILSTFKDEKWTSFTDGRGERREVRDVVHMDGKFYCIFDHQKGSYKSLGIMNVARQRWRTNKFDLWPEVYRYMFELDGELCLLTDASGIWKIRHLDRSEQNWKRTKSLGDGVLFLNRISLSSSSMVTVGEANKDFANMIVHLGRSGYETYTCENDQGEWNHHQTHGCDPFGRYAYCWIDGPNF